MRRSARPATILNPAGGRTLAALALLACVAARAAAASDRPAAGGPPIRLADTGLYTDFSRGLIHPEALPYAPQYPLWSDGATKRRWIRLPRGAAIDGRDPDAWRFPVGTRIWKEFSFGRRVETRFMERTRAGWRFATYAWTEDGRDAALAPSAGVRDAAPGATGRTHDLPSVRDCQACHEGARSTVLGFSALQLSPDRDPLAPHAEPLPPGGVQLADLEARGLLRGSPPGLSWPRIPAASPRERAALGYLHANCANCHNGSGPLAGLGLDLEQRLGRPGQGALATTVGRPSSFRSPAAAPGFARIAPGEPARSVLLLRMHGTDPVTAMPPLGHKAADAAATALVGAWIGEDLAPAPAGATPTQEERR
jgi:hypothetical protein